MEKGWIGVLITTHKYRFSMAKEVSESEKFKKIELLKNLKY